MFTLICGPDARCLRPGGEEEHHGEGHGQAEGCEPVPLEQEEVEGAHDKLWHVLNDPEPGFQRLAKAAELLDVRFLEVPRHEHIEEGNFQAGGLCCQLFLLVSVGDLLQGRCCGSHEHPHDHQEHLDSIDQKTAYDGLRPKKP